MKAVIASAMYLPFPSHPIPILQPATEPCTYAPLAAFSTLSNVGQFETHTARRVSNSRADLALARLAGEGLIDSAYVYEYFIARILKSQAGVTTVTANPHSHAPCTARVEICDVTGNLQAPSQQGAVTNVNP